MKKISKVLIILVSFTLGCTTTQTTNPVISNASPKTQLQLREFQTRSYDTDDTEMIMKAMVNVLQDDGFAIQNANVDLGLITATKEMSVFDKAGYEKYVKQLRDFNFAASIGCCLFPLLFSDYQNPKIDPSDFYVNVTMFATINVTKFGNQTRMVVIT